MKLSLDTFGLGLILAALPFVSGCGTDVKAAGNTTTVSSDTSSAVVQPQVAATPASVASTAPAPVNVEPASLAVENPTLPADIDPDSPVASVVKLIQAGVSEPVILAFIANSAMPFNLDSDEIIYLRDLGASDSVTTAMIERDKDLGVASQPQPDNTPQPTTTVVQQSQPTTTYVQSVPADDYAYFYDSLAPYGSWVYIEGYGRCWQPTVVVVNSGWQPYCDNGRWLYTDCGWYWHSDYSWGWAPFHYGRWFRDPHRGWCWLPGSVWGPSWVSWRYSTDYCGWAPLPPAARFTTGVGFTYYGSSVSVSFGFGLTSDCYTFVPTSHFCDSRPWEHRVPRGRETTIYNNTTVINNVIVGDNNTIINRGIGSDRIEAATHTHLRPVEVRHEREANPPGGRHERFDQSGGTLIVDQPPLNQRPPRAGRTPAPGNTVTRNTPTPPQGNNAGNQRGQRDPRAGGNSAANNNTSANAQSTRGGRSIAGAPVGQTQPPNRTQPRSDANTSVMNNPNPVNTRAPGADRTGPATSVDRAQPSYRPQPRNDANTPVINNPNPVNNRTPRGGRAMPQTPAIPSQPTINPPINNGGNRVAPTRPSEPAAIQNRGNPNALQDRRQQPAFTPAPAQENSPRYSSPRIQGNDSVRVAPAQPTFPGNGNSPVSQPRTYTSPPQTPRNSPSGNAQIGRTPSAPSVSSAPDSRRQNPVPSSGGQPRSSAGGSNSGRGPRGNNP